MDRISVSDAGRNLETLVDEVVGLGTSIDLERDEQVVARIMPVRYESKLKVRDLGAFLANLPSLGDDAVAFEEDLQAVRREFPAETNPWD